MTDWLVPALAATVAVYAAGVLVLVVLGRRGDARAAAGFVPDCVVLMRRLLGDPALPRRRKAILLVLVAYLATPIDLVPVFVPVAGALDDALIVALALRTVLRGAPPERVRGHWPGPERSWAVVAAGVGNPWGVW